MGILQKLGLVEADECSLTVAETVPSVNDTAQEQAYAEVNAEIKDTDGIVDEIYAQNGMGDKSDSIYAIDKLIATLPSEMTTVKKQQTVAGILGVTGKSTTTLMLDGTNRTEVLEAARNITVGQCEDEIAANKAHIEELKAEIEECEKLISQSIILKEATNKAVNDEIAFIDELVKFCEGMEVK